jgi:hypothetical protein
MADLKPIGSEKLSGDDKIKRILELTYYKNSNNKTSKSAPEMVTESKTGGVYGIVKEKDGYYVKRGLNESSLDYIGGLFMKNKNKFSSYAEALKRLELLKGQEELQEATKYVLKNKPSQEEAAPVEPPMDMPPPPPSEEPAGELPADGEMEMPVDGEEPVVPEEPTMGPEGEEGGESKRSDYMAEVQKYAGKLGQELRDQKEKMESDDIKYVLNMIISAVDLEKLEDEDIEEIGKKFERDEEEMSGEEVPSEEPEMGDEEVPAEEPAPEEDLGEVDGIDALEAFVNTPVDMVDEIGEIDLSDYADIDESNHEDEELKEIDLDQIKADINQSVEETLSKYFNQ